MPELVNRFSWSFSAAEDFDECRRKRYWGKYAMWGGWSGNATATQRAAYRLSKMDNRYSLLGDAVELAVMWMLRQKQAGVNATVDQAYEGVARPFLNKAWQESRSRLWERDPKRHCCLREHYYNELDAEGQKAWVTFVADQTKLCLTNFVEGVLPKLEAIRKEQELPIAKADAGDPESFDFEGIKIYAIPDYAYRVGDRLHIHDWKAGKPKENHKDQLALYGLWANVKHSAEPSGIHAYIEYLSKGIVDSKQLTAEDLEEVKARVAESVADMAEYLVDGNVARNQPVPKEQWELAVSTTSCRMCNFYELCKPELEGQQ